ncbi:hypothetical protein TNCV_1214571 [Trichonephila clavipes]|nr:hypothetical protein TNCV_1214571 [Trichonephila clavipes]
MTNRFKRIAFEKDQIHKPLEFWRTVIFSDEGKFCIFGIKGCKLVWRKPCTVLQKEHLVPTHDNDPKQTAEVVKLWLLYNVPNQLHMAPQSSDLNPAEHL